MIYPTIGPSIKYLHIPSFSTFTLQQFYFGVWLWWSNLLSTIWYQLGFCKILPTAYFLDMHNLCFPNNLQIMLIWSCSHSQNAILAAHWIPLKISHRFHTLMTHFQIFNHSLVLDTTLSSISTIITPIFNWVYF
jgi:hypothetical protein